MVQLQYDKLFPDITKLVLGKNKKAEAHGIKAETENDDFLEGFNYYSNEEKKEKDELSKYLTRDGAALSATKPPSSYTIPSSVTPPPPKDTEEKDEFLEGFNYSDEEKKEEKKEFSMFLPQEKNPLDYPVWQQYLLQRNRFSVPPTADQFFDESNVAAGERGRFPNTELHPRPRMEIERDKALEEKKRSDKERLDRASKILTAASFVPGLDSVTNLAQMFVDIEKGDYLGVGLDLVGAIPFIGELGDGAKYARTADKVIDGARAADKVADGIKAADNIAESIRVADSIKVADEVAESIRAVDTAHDAAKAVDAASDATKNTGSLKTYLDAVDDPIAELTKMSDDIALKSPIRIPEGATKSIEVKNNGYYQIKYSWTADDGFEYTSRWHTQRPNAPIEQGDTFVVERVMPGVGHGQKQRKRVEQIRVGENMWVSKEEWKKASRSRGRGTLTKEQEEILNNGHWKA